MHPPVSLSGKRSAQQLPEITCNPPPSRPSAPSALIDLPVRMTNPAPPSHLRRCQTAPHIPPDCRLPTSADQAVPGAIGRRPAHHHADERAVALIYREWLLRLVVLELPVAQAPEPLTDLLPRLGLHAGDAGLQLCAQLTLIELPDINHQMVPGVAQTDLPAPGCEPLRAAGQPRRRTPRQGCLASQ
jgi:hypothetical protein